MSKINCKFCNKKYGIKAIEDHLSECIQNNINDKNGYLIEFISSSGITNKSYQMFAIFGTKCKFNHIDKFLRMIWCECCRHKSTIDVFEEVNKDKTHKCVNFNTLISKYEHANQFIYSYDMFLTTDIYFRIIKKLEGNINDTNYELLYRNEPFKIKCNNYKKCKEFGTCIYYFNVFCNECKNVIDEDEQEYILKLSNSPRTGICEYEDNIVI
jgi:hypothetical protein